MIDTIDGSITGIQIGVGESIGRLFATKFGVRGNKDLCVIGSTVHEANEAEDEYYLDDRNVVHFNTHSKGGGHAIMVYGWNDEGWLCQNSWSDQFGNHGRFVLPYSYGLVEARVLVDDTTLDSNSVESAALQRPVNNKILNVFYCAGNFILNLFKKK